MGRAHQRHAARAESLVPVSCQIYFLHYCLLTCGWFKKPLEQAVLPRYADDAVAQLLTPNGMQRCFLRAYRKTDGRCQA